MSRSTTSHVLVEIDGRRDGHHGRRDPSRQARVISCRRGPFSGWGGALREEVLQSVRGASFGACEVHVVMDSSGFAAFDLNLPKLGRDELHRVAEREARHRLTRGDEAPALFGIGRGRPLPNKLQAHSILALSSETLGFLKDCIADPLLRVRQVVRRDDALALVLADHLPPCVVCLRAQRGGLRCELVENSALKSGV